MLLMIDNYDSFTYNLVQYFGELGEEVKVIRNDEIDVAGIAALKPDHIVVSQSMVAKKPKVAQKIVNAWYDTLGTKLSVSFSTPPEGRSLLVRGGVRLDGVVIAVPNDGIYLPNGTISSFTILGALVDSQPELERLAPISLNIVCFRFNPGGLDENALNALNKEILMQLHEKGIAAPSYTTLGERYCLRIAIANHRSTNEDFDLLAREVVRIGKEVVKRA